MAVSGCPNGRLGADIGASTWPVVDDKWLAKPLRQPLAEKACGRVGWAARERADDDARRPRRISFGPRDARCRRQRGGAHCETQESTARKLRCGLSLRNA